MTRSLPHVTVLHSEYDSSNRFVFADTLLGSSKGPESLRASPAIASIIAGSLTPTPFPHLNLRGLRPIGLLTQYRRIVELRDVRD